jgi:hypothetical protein
MVIDLKVIAPCIRNDASVEYVNFAYGPSIEPRLFEQIVK